MKNIHLIPTDKSSRLCYDKDDNLLFAPNAGFTIADGKQNIYITNSEEIKEGDWFMIFTNKKPIAPTKAGLFDSDCKKIILTTDEDLIKDGVQAIDDEFLEWFVKNPSCEFVKLDSACKCVECGSSVKSSCDYAYKCRPQISYEIIIPQEEPKQETIEQSERRYSEEDMFEFSQWISHEDWVYLPSKGYWVNEEQEELEQKLSSKEILNLWFEQFKKK
jgi:hypothetical protein